MAFEPAATNAIESLVAPRAAATNATSGGDSSNLFQSLVADAVAPGGETGVPTTTTNATVPPANTGGAFVLLLQTGETPVQTTPADPSAATPFAQTAFTSDAAEPAPSAPVAIDTAGLVEQPGVQSGVVEPQPKTASAPAIPKNGAAATTTTAPAASATPTTTQIAAAQPAKAADPSEATPATTIQTDDQTAAAAAPQGVVPTPDPAQAIVFAPFVTAPAQPVVKPAASKSGDAINTEQADAAPKSDLFKKTAFGAAPVKSNAGNAGNTGSASAFTVRVAPDAQPSPQAAQVQRPDFSQPGSASPISGFEAPRAAADAISTPVARAVHGAAAMQVAQSISRNFHGNSSNFEVRLDPAELGRVDVKISVDHDKRVTASVSADNPQTLTDLRGAARDIERALNEAGLDLAQGGLSFEMNQRQANDDEFDASPYAAGKEDAAGGEPLAIAAKPFGMERWSNAGVDVWA